MKAKVKIDFVGRPDNEPVSRKIPVGEIIEGDLAIAAVANKWAVEIREEKGGKK